MRFLILHLVIPLVVVVAVARCTSTTPIATYEQRESIKDILQQLLEVAPPSTKTSFDVNLHASQHMWQLYQRFVAGGKNSGEIVRNVLPIADTSQFPVYRVEDMLVFNLTSARKDDDVRLSQLHLYRRRMPRHLHPLHPRLLAPPYRVRVCRLLTGVNRPRALPIASVPVPQISRGGWHSVDITDAVREVLLSATSANVLVAIRFESPKGRRLPLNGFLDASATSFLMVFARETNSDHDLERAVQEHLDHLYNGGAGNALSQSYEKLRHKSYRDDDEMNRIVPMDVEPKARLNRKLTRRRKKTKYNEATKFKTNLIEELLENSDTRRVIRSPEDEALLAGGFLELFNASQEADVAPPKRNGTRDNICAKKSLEISFQDLGWDNFVLFPKSFPLNYCAGTCPPFRHKKYKHGLNKCKPEATNRAQVTNFLRALVAPPDENPADPSSPCCAPKTLKPLVALYAADQTTTVLKIYPNLIVDACRCQ